MQSINARLHAEERANRPSGSPLGFKCHPLMATDNRTETSTRTSREIVQVSLLVTVRPNDSADRTTNGAGHDRMTADDCTQTRAGTGGEGVQVTLLITVRSDDPANSATDARSFNGVRSDNRPQPRRGSASERI
jgi:hypothetical protein